MNQVGPIPWSRCDERYVETRRGQNADPFYRLAGPAPADGRLVDEGMQRVLAHGQFILGPEVGELETALSELCGAPM